MTTVESQSAGPSCREVWKLNLLLCDFSNQNETGALCRGQLSVAKSAAQVHLNADLDRSGNS